MREYKFRGLDKFGIWHYGLPSYGTNNQIAEIEVKCCGEFVEVIPETIGQYTGLKDKNGKKIYEGDVLKYENEVYKMLILVEWNNKEAAFDFKVIFHSWDDRCRDVLGLLRPAYYSKRSKIVGNIYDNPELLEVKQ